MDIPTRASRRSLESAGVLMNTKATVTPEESLNKAYYNMMARCYNPSMSRYEHYGGRGITVCKRWRQSKQAFIDDMGTRPSPLHTLDRKNVNGNYTPRNCRWALPQEQDHNRTRVAATGLRCIYYTPKYRKPWRVTVLISGTRLVNQFSTVREAKKWRDAVWGIQARYQQEQVIGGTNE